MPRVNVTLYSPEANGCRCAECPLQGVRDVGPVKPIGGAFDATFAVVTDAPPPISIRRGAVTSTPYSKFIDSALTQAGKSPDSCFRTHMILCRPEEGIVKYLSWLKQENKSRGVAQRKYDRAMLSRTKKFAKATLSWNNNNWRAAIAWRKKFAKSWEKFTNQCRRIDEKNVTGQDRIDLKNERMVAQNAKIKEQNDRIDHQNIRRRENDKSDKPHKPYKIPLPRFKPLPYPHLPETAEVPVFPPAPEITPMPEFPGDTTELNNPIDCCRPRVVREIENCDAVIAVGAPVFRALFKVPDGKLDDEMGFPFRLDGRGYFPAREVDSADRHAIRALPSSKRPLYGIAMPSPVGFFRDERKRWQAGPFIHWTKKLASIQRKGGPEWSEPEPLYTKIRTAYALNELIKEADRHMWAGEEPIRLVCDVETSGFNVVYDLLRCIGFSWGQMGAVIAVHSVHGPFIGNWSLIRLACKLLGHPWIRPIFHNGSFDRAVLETFFNKHFGKPDGHHHISLGGDTLLAHHAVESELWHSLAFVSTLTTDCPSWKADDGGGDHGVSETIDERLWLYCFRDCWRTQKVDDVLAPHIIDDDLEAIYDQACRVQPWVADIQRRGLYVYIDRLDGLVARLAEEHTRCVDEIARAIQAGKARRGPEASLDFDTVLMGDTFQYGKPDHLQAAMKLLEIDTPLTKTGLRTTNKDDLMRALPHLTGDARAFIGAKVTEHTEGKGLQGAKSTTKITSTFCNTEGVDEDGRRRTSWKQHGAVTGRWSSGEKKVVKTDTNLQNVPKWVRMIYGAPEGFKLVSADYSALELWVIAIFCEAPSLLNALQSSDVHRFNTEGLFNISFFDQMTEAASTGCGGKERILDPETKKPFPSACGVARLSPGTVILDDKGKKIDIVDIKTDCKACQAVAREAARLMMQKLTGLRVQGKRFVYAANYQGSDTSIWLKLQTEFPSLQLSEVQGMMEAWNTMNPQIKEKAYESYELFHRRKLKGGIGYLTSPILGRRRYWTGGEFKVTDASNYPIQSGGADIVNEAITRIGPALKRIGVDLVWQVHDDFGAEAPDHLADEALAILCRELPGKYTFKSGMKGEWSFPVEGAIGQFWDEV